MATLVASEVSPERVFTAVSEECARVLQVNASIVLRYEGDGTATIVGRHNRDNIDVFHVGERLPAEAALGVRARADDRGAGADRRLGRAHGRGRRGDLPHRLPIDRGRADRRRRARCGARSRSRARTRCRRTARTASAAFCELASLAVASAQARADLIASRARLVKAGDEQRRRLERNLHDGAQQRFVSVVLKLRLARARLATHPDATADLLDDASRELDTGLQELREIARGLHPAILGEQGLRRALEALAERLPVPSTSTPTPSACPSTSRRPPTTSSPRR